MPFAAGSVVTSAGKAIVAKRMFGATPTQLEPKYIAMGTGATGAARTAAVRDTALSTEVESRTAGTGSRDDHADQRHVPEHRHGHGERDARGRRGGHVRRVEHRKHAHVVHVPVVNLASGDSIAFTIKVQFT
jgi:hypothetical protein